MMDENFVLAVVVDGVLYTAPLAWVSHPGVGYADENAAGIEIRTEQRVPGGKPEIVIEWEVSGHDMDPGIEMEEIWSSRQIAVVSLDSGAPRWVAALRTERESSYGPMEGWDGEPAKARAGDLEVSREAVELSWGDGQITVTARGEASAPVGSFALASYPLRCPAELASF
jgi:hypothetical protein